MTVSLFQFKDFYFLWQTTILKWFEKNKLPVVEDKSLSKFYYYPDKSNVLFQLFVDFDKKHNDLVWSPANQNKILKKLSKDLDIVDWVDFYYEPANDPYEYGIEIRKLIRIKPKKFLTTEANRPILLTSSFVEKKAVEKINNLLSDRGIDIEQFASHMGNKTLMYIASVKFLPTDIKNPFTFSHQITKASKDIFSKVVLTMEYPPILMIRIPIEKIMNWAFE